MNDDLGDRMKAYESAEAGRRFMPLLPVMARLDGKNFSNFTKGLTRPYDKGLSDLMIEVTKNLVEETNARCGYTQSDEITLVWFSEEVKSQIFFDGRVQKMTSVLASVCSTTFNLMLPEMIPEKAKKRPVFDCRVWQLPNLTEAANAFLWRELDASKNSISMAAQEFYSTNELFGKSGKEKQEMLFAKGVNWNDYPAFFKRGTYVRRKTFTGKVSPEELETLPPLHHARKNPDLEFERSEVRTLELPPLNRLANRVNVIFYGHEPETLAP